VGQGGADHEEGIGPEAQELTAMARKHCRAAESLF